MTKGENMTKIIETNKLLVKWENVAEDKQLLGLIFKHMSMKATFDNEIQDAIQKLSQHFQEKGYNEEELTALIMNTINLAEDGYHIIIDVYVYPTEHENVQMSRRVTEMFIKYMSADYRKEQNEIGKTILEKVNTIIQILNLKKENEALKRKLKEYE